MIGVGLKGRQAGGVEHKIRGKGGRPLTAEQIRKLIEMGAQIKPSQTDGEAKGDRNTRIFVRADRVVPYGELMNVMNLLRAAGFLKVALVGLEKTQ